MSLITKHKSNDQLDAMREGGKILATIFQEIRQFAKAGITEKEIDSFTERRIAYYGASPAYKESTVNFPGVICISTNSEVVHAIPTDRILKKGDLVSFDMVIRYKGMCTDSGFCMVIDQEPTDDVKRLIDYTERALYAGINAIKGPTRVGNISSAIERVLREGCLGIVEELVGHGVGHKMHMPPDIPNYGVMGTGPLLRPGDTIAIEPITTLGGAEIIQLDDGWTIATRDGSLSAYAEHTILVTKDGAEILTRL
ncbi:type I methionyl aminopeptidase [Candidatus Saccharibacteria bacterium]|nr:type I methionyl aminopeptidase [Candidatus Saccharibacteria bacterium]NCU40547.1 type I methionyl aminopeptidase [Candidatus Saccharibacteria bacterium]